MVHRSADSRLLVNLLQHEKEYAKHLNNTQDLSNNSLTSFAAYAAASPQPTSQVILSVAGSLAAADEALRRYVLGVDEWREAMRGLKEMEEEVGNIMRDREILVTRVIKASRSQKSGAANIRDSLLLGHQKLSSASSLSLTSSPPDSPSPASSRPLSGSFSISIPSSSKLAAAQAELQACETHLAAKEQELAIRRCTALKDGLGARMRAMAECGWAWNEIGKEACKTLDELHIPHSRNGSTGSSTHEAIVHDSRTSSPHPLVRNPRPTIQSQLAGQESSRTARYSTASVPEQRLLHYPSAPEIMESPMSGFSSLGPSQSASQVTHHHHEQQQQQQQGQGDAPPPISILSLLDPGAAFAGQSNTTRTAGAAAIPLGGQVHPLPPGQASSEGKEPSGQTTMHGEEQEEEDLELEYVDDDEQQPTPTADAVPATTTTTHNDDVSPAVISSTIAPKTDENPPLGSNAIANPRPSSPKADDRPPSNGSSGSHASSTYYTPVTPTTYTTETISYAPAIAVHVQPGKELDLGDSTQIGEHNKPLTPSPLQFQSQQPQQQQSSSIHADDGVGKLSPYAPVSRVSYFEEDFHRSVIIPPAHAIGEYDVPLASTIPLASSSASLKRDHQQQQHRADNNSPAKRNSLLMRLSSLGTSSSSTPSPSTSGPHTPIMASGSHTPIMGSSGVDKQLESQPFARHVLERRITEEELKRMSQDNYTEPQGHMGEDQVKVADNRAMVVGEEVEAEEESSEENEERWMKEGKLKLVENPRFMSEERKREIEKKERKEREEAEARKSKGKGKAKQKESVDDEGDGDEKDKKKGKISFVGQQQHKRGSESTVNVQQSGGGVSPGKPAHHQHQSSPSKGFLGSIKGLFHTRLAGPAPSSPQSPGQKLKGDHRRTVSEAVVPVPVKAEPDAVEESDDDDDSSIVVERSPSKSSGFHLFGGRKKSNKDKEMKWETRTDKNLKKLEAAVASAASGGGGGGRRKFSMDESGGGGSASMAVVDAGGIERVMRTASVTGGGSNASVLSDAKNERERKKLRKTRGGGGGAGLVMEVVPGQEGTATATANVNNNNNTPFPKSKEHAGAAPVRRQLSQAQTPPQQRKTGLLNHRRSASVDVGVQQRRSFVESQQQQQQQRQERERGRENAENEMMRQNNWNEMRRNDSGEDRKSFADSDHGTVNGIVDLGNRRRRAASEVGHGTKTGGGAGDITSTPPPPVPVHAPVGMGYVPTAPGSVLNSVHMDSLQDIDTTPKPIRVQPYVRPETMEMTPGSGVVGQQRKSSMVKGRKTSSDVGYQTTTSPPPPPPHPVQSQHSTSPPLSRRQSTRTVPVTTTSPPRTQQQQQQQAPSPVKQTSPSSTHTAHIGKATVLPAGGGHPSGTYDAQSGWSTQPGALISISRNTSVRSSASAPSGPGMGVPYSRGAKMQKQTVLGQGMPMSSGASSATHHHHASGAGLGRHSSLGHSPGMGMGGASVAASTQHLRQQQQQQQQHQHQQQQQPAQSLLKIVEDVAKVNKKGWGHGVGSSVGVQGGGIGVPSAPPRVLTEKLKAMEPDTFRTKVGANTVGGQSAAKTRSTTTTPKAPSQGLWEIKAPGSVWDQRQALMEMEEYERPKRHSGIYKAASMSAPDLTSAAGVSRGRPIGSPRTAESRVPNGYQHGTVPSAATSATSASSTPGHPQKMPLRSAMKHPSRTPSPLVSGSPHAWANSGPPVASTSPYSSSPLVRQEPLSGGVGVSAPPQVENLKKKDKGKGKAVDDSDTGADSSAYETGNEAFYTDEESGAESKARGKKPILAAPLPYPTQTGGMNGHAISGHAEPSAMKGSSDVSRSDTSGHGTVRGTPTASDQYKQPRRRKSVRVSLQPTFSPSPPAIEYDDDEEQKRHAPWAFEPKSSSSSRYDSIETRTSEQTPHHHHHVGTAKAHYNPAIASPTPHAPAKQHAIVKKEKAEKDIWEDSSDDDDAYMRAKQALSEAAKFEKDVTLMVANRRF